MPLCTVTGTLTKANGGASAGSVVAWTPDIGSGLVSFVDGVALTRDEIVIRCNEHGQFSINLVQGASLRLRIDDLGLYRQVRIPEQASATLEEVLNADL